MLTHSDQQPGELTGFGAVPASMARRMAADPTGTWRRLVVDPLGGLLDYGTSTYRPPADLTRHVIARDQLCVFPTCAQSAWRCDLDHRTPFPAGPTSADNLQPLCRRHHLLKHHSDWTVTRDDTDGSYDWTSPTRHRYKYRPPEYPIPTTTTPDPKSDPTGSAARTGSTGSTRWTEQNRPADQPINDQEPPPF
jgi:hypothetical protein